MKWLCIFSKKFIISEKFNLKKSEFWNILHFEKKNQPKHYVMLWKKINFNNNQKSSTNLKQSPTVDPCMVEHHFLKKHALNLLKCTTNISIQALRIYVNASTSFFHCFILKNTNFPDKALVAEGIFSRFYKICRSIIKDALMVAIQQISRYNGTNFHSRNSFTQLGLHCSPP